MKAEFIAPDDPRWRALLKRTPHDFYHLPDYLVFCARMEGGEPLAFYAEEGEGSFLVPLLVRPLPSELKAPPAWRDAVTPYGYPSPLLEGNPDRLGSFMDGFLKRAAERQIVSVFLRLHPLIPLAPGPLGARGELVRHGKTVYFDLSRTPEEIRRGMRENHRRDIRKLTRDGFSVRFDDWDLMDDFTAVYLQTMGRLGADDFYHFSPAYFRGLCEVLGDSLHLGSVLSPAGEVCAAALFVLNDGIVQYHLGGTAEGYLPRAPSKLLFDFTWRWAKEEGARLFNLGGGLGGRDDSLFRFKEGFSPFCADFHTLRIVSDMEKYASLAELWQREFQEKDESNDFFPLYRRKGSRRVSSSEEFSHTVPNTEACSERKAYQCR